MRCTRGFPSAGGADANDSLTRQTLMLLCFTSNQNEDLTHKRVSVNLMRDVCKDDEPPVGIADYSDP